VLSVIALLTQVSNSLPSVSPDGNWIAFISDRGGVENAFVIAPDGTGRRQLTAGGAQSVRWSPDGKTLRLTAEGADSGRAFTVLMDGTDRRVVAEVAGRNPRLSPDGTRVAYLSGSWTATAMMVADADGSKARRVAGGGTTAWNTAWSPNGERLAYAYGDSTRLLQVHVVNPDGSNDVALTRMPASEGSAQMPEWSPDGRRIAIQVSNLRTHTGHIWIVDLSSGEARKLAAHADGILDEVPAWFPDGKRIAFQSNRGGTMEIWVMNADGSGMRQVTR
jgi:TolB protein